MLGLVKHIGISLVFFASVFVFADSSTSSDNSKDSHSLNNFFYQLLHERPTEAGRTAIPEKAEDPRVRIHQEGILEISGTTVTPVKINVRTGPVGVIGTVEITKRDETNSRWFFRAENISQEQNIWDAQGRAVLVPGKVTCQVLHRASLNDYKQAGLVLGVDASIPGLGKAGFETSTSQEHVLSEFYEGEDICPIGEVAPFTTQKEIETRCKKCLGSVLKTIRQDVQSRLNHLTYYVQAPGCKDDGACYREDNTWTVGRCVLIKDKNDSHYTDCRARSSIGGACKGEGSRGLFELPCDKGLACIKVHSSTGWGDYNRYECRSRQNPRFKGPLRIQNRGDFSSAQTDLELYRGALDSFFASHQRFPSTADGLKTLALKKDGIPMNTQDPFSPFSGPYLYASDGKNYKLISVGPDGKANTSDDLIIKK